MIAAGHRDDIDTGWDFVVVKLPGTTGNDSSLGRRFGASDAGFVPPDAATLACETPPRSPHRAERASSGRATGRQMCSARFATASAASLAVSGSVGCACTVRATSSALAPNSTARAASGGL